MLKRQAAKAVRSSGSSKSANSSFSSSAARNPSKRPVSEVPKSSKSSYSENQAGAAQPPADRAAVMTESGREYHVCAITTPSKQRLIRLRDVAAKRTASVPFRLFGGSANEARRAAGEQGIIVVGTKNWNAIVTCVASLSAFPNRLVAERPGWNANRFFAYGDGSLIAPDGDEVRGALFERATVQFGSRGTLQAWQRNVLVPLAEHKIPAFIMMAAFASPVLCLRGNPMNLGFEIAGPAGRGKSTVQRCIASAAGNPAATGSYWISANATMNGLETMMPRYCDMPLILDEAATFSGGANRAAEMRRLVFMLAEGRSKLRFGDSIQATTRFLYVISTNEPLHAMLVGSHRDTLNAALSRLITIPIAEDRPFGIFDHIPDGYSSSGDFARALERAVEQDYGFALKVFIRRLVDCRSEDDAGLRSEIDMHMDRFRKASGADPNNGAERRLADAFGFVYAVGQLARSWGVLPKSLRCGAVALAMFRLHLNSGRPIPPLSERLKGLIKRQDVLDVGDGNSELSNEAYASAAAFLYSGRGGRELLLNERQRRQHFPDWGTLKRELDGLWLVRPNEKRWKVQRILGTGRKREWLYSILVDRV